MIRKPAGKVLRKLTLVVGAAAIFSTSARAQTPSDRARTPETRDVDSPEVRDDAARIEEPADSAILEHGFNAHLLPFRMPASDGSEQLAIEGATPHSPPDVNLYSIRGLAATPHLNYYGGPVISHVKVVMVEYGSGTYQSFITGSMPGFFSGVTNSAYMTWLTEYNTKNQTIGTGTWNGNVPITPASSRNKTTITDLNIQAELSAQITAGHLPAPDSNTLYMVFFPKGKTISQGGSRSCVAGGFCAYHGTFSRNGQYVYYGVLPDMSAGSGCDRGCGSGTPFANQTSVASHEMIEAVTDAGVGLATSFAPPLAWYDPNNGEIGDICNAQQGTISTANGTFTVQKEWSNASGACIVHK